MLKRWRADDLQRVPSNWPALQAEGRQRLLLAIGLSAVLQALLAGLMAVGVRWSFQALHQKSGLPVGAILMILGAGVFFAALRWAERVQSERVGQAYVHSLRLALLKHLSALPFEAMTWRHQGHVMQRLSGDMTAVRQWVGRGITRLLSAAISLPILSLLMILWFPPVLALGVLLPVLAALLVTLPLALSLQGRYRHLGRARSRLSATVAERLPHLQALRQSGRQKREALMVDQLGQRVMQAAVQRQAASALLRVAPDVLRGVALAWVLAGSFWVGAAPADTAACLAALGLMMPMVRDLGNVADRYAAWRIARQRLWHWLGLPRLQAAKAATERPATAASETDLMVLKEIQFGSVDAFSADIAPGRKIVISGEPGSGKSHLIRILAGLSAPLTGQVLFGWVGRQRPVVRHLSAHSPILSGSLRRALTLGCRHRADDEHVLAMAHRFDLTRLLERLGGLDGRLAENGANLTSHELRRVLLVRAALSDADLLLVDDLDDLVDSQTQAAWSECMSRASAAMVFVSQDKQMHALADEIWLIGHDHVTVHHKSCEV